LRDWEFVKYNWDEGVSKREHSDRLHLKEPAACLVHRPRRQSSGSGAAKKAQAPLELISAAAAQRTSYKL